MKKVKRKCKVKSCERDAAYQGICLAHLNPLLAPGQPGQDAVRYWPPPGRRTATQRPDETRKDKP